MRQHGMTGMQFEKLILWQLGKFIERSACKAMASDVEEDPVSGTILMVLKFMLAHSSLKTKAGGEEKGGGLSDAAYGPSLPSPPAITGGREAMKISTW